MSTEILINITPMETRVALVENGLLQEVRIERSKSRGLVGNIYLGRVARVLPGMQAAFVDIGLEKAGFIHVDDLVCRPNANGQTSAGVVPDIRQLLREGQSLLVEVLKDPLGTKGARLTSQLSISSRYLVYMPDVDHIGISQRIENETERDRLLELMGVCLSGNDAEKPTGYIIRTAAEGIESTELKCELVFLQRLWRHLEKKISRAEVPSNIYRDLPLHLQILRDMVGPDVEKIRVDSRETLDSLKAFANEFCPEMTPLIEYYPGERPLFYMYGIEGEIEKALSRKVPLKSGGYLVIDQTEAMTTVDVNTGAFVGHHNLEETIFKTNLEAVTSIARQLRLRNLGGIIILDFIDMDDPEHRRQVLRTLEKALARDRVKTSITGISELGLVEMTRKRTSESLENQLCEPCNVCGGKGTLKTAETVCYEIMREILRESRAYECSALLVMASQVVIDRLLDEDSTNIADLEEFIGCPIRFRVEGAYSQEQFDIVPV